METKGARLAWPLDPHVTTPRREAHDLHGHLILMSRHPRLLSPSALYSKHSLLTDQHHDMIELN